MNRPARIMHVHFWGDVRLQAGSVDKVIAAFAGMDEPDFDIAVACPGSGGPERSATATWHFFAEDRLKNRVANKLLGLKLFTYSELAALIKRERPDLLHLHNRHALLAPLLARLDYRPRVLCHYHRKFGEFVVPPQADGLIAVSDAVRVALLAAASPTMPVTVLHNPVPEALGVSLPHPTGNRPRLVYGGGRQQNKGFFELEAALGNGLAEQFDIVLCGPGFDGYRPPFPARVAGMLPSDAFLAELRAADVVAMPSHHEGFSILALEALGLGKLLVATQGGGLGEILDADNALIHPAGDATALAGCLRQALTLLAPEGEAAGQRMRDAASRTAARFSVTAINRQLAAIYRQYLGMTSKESV
ncbi:MAG TPA: glycosyltransferase family 4 protein [Azonexus sp.]|nr:glycosyltransferase family 4 protein [Azonexus sp.]